MMRNVALLTFSCLLLIACGGGGNAVREDPRIRQGRELYDRSEFERAQKHFETLESEARQTGDELLLAQAVKWLGSIQIAYERPEQALTFYRRSLDVLDRGIERSDSAGRPPDELWLDERQNVLSNIAVAYKSTDRFDEAESLFRDVLAYDRAHGDDYRSAISLYNLADLLNQHAVALRLAGKRSESKAKLAVARTLFHESLALVATGDAWLNLGNNYALGDDIDSAVVAYHRAEDIYRRSGYRVHRALALGNIGVLSLKRGHREEAAEALRGSIDIIEELRGSITSIDIRSSFVSDKFFIYENLIALLAQMGKVQEAFLYVERAKARSFLDLIGNKSIGQGKQRPPDIQALVDREVALQHRIAGLVGVTDSTGVLNSALAEHKDVLAELKQRDPEYFVGHDTTFAFVVRSDTVELRLLPMKRGRDLERAVEAVRRPLYYDFPMRKTAFFREQRLGKGLSPEAAERAWYDEATDNAWQIKLIEMYSRVFAPIRPLLGGITQLYIVPHGPLHHLPFQALTSPLDADLRPGAHMPRPRYLIEDFAMGFLPSASVLGFALEHDVDSVRSALIVGDPVDADPKYRRRPRAGALIEADTVAAYADHPLLLKREDAEEARVKREIGDKELLHFATHGELNKKDPLQSRILLAAAHPDSINDGSLTVQKIFNLDLRAMLVTLSACQTAQLAAEDGGFTPGDDLVGLTRSFMYAGTPAVVASLWYVDDDATLAWMRQFYRSWLQEGRSRMQSARTAALRMLNEPADPDWRFPYYWSAFVYMGDAR